MNKSAPLPSVLHINTMVQGSGAALAARHVFHACRTADQETKFLNARHKSDDDPDLLWLGEQKWRTIANVVAFRFFGIEGAFNRLLWSQIRTQLNQFDILHLHNMHGYYLPFDVLADILRHYRVVWTLHDFWPLLGGPTYPYSEFYKKPRSLWGQPDYPKELINRGASRARRLKQLIETARPWFVLPSQNMLERAGQMGLPLEQAHVIHHGLFGAPQPNDNPQIDERQVAKSELGWDDEKTHLVFAATQIPNPLKGWSVLEQAIKQLKNRQNYVLHVLGGRFEDAQHACQQMGISAEFAGLQPLSIVQHYMRAADLFITPSFDETFGLTVVEALAEGADVICSDLPVLMEIAGEDGCYIPCGDAAALCMAIENHKSATLSHRQARQKNIRNRYAISTMRQAHFSLYQNVMSS